MKNVESKYNLFYSSIIRDEILNKYRHTNPYHIPKIDKIQLSCTGKDLITSSDWLFQSLLAIELISGRKPVLGNSKKSIANFKLKKNFYISACVTLRKEIMYSFLDKLSNVIIPRLKGENPFKKSSISYNSNSVTIGIKSLTIFPEIEIEHHLFESLTGINITFVFSKNNSISLIDQTNILSILRTFCIPLK